MRCGTQTQTAIDILNPGRLTTHARCRQASPARRSGIRVASRVCIFVAMPVKCRVNGPTLRERPAVPSELITTRRRRSLRPVVRWQVSASDAAEAHRLIAGSNKRRGLDAITSRGTASRSLRMIGKPGSARTETQPRDDQTCRLRAHGSYFIGPDQEADPFWFVRRLSSVVVGRLRFIRRLKSAGLNAPTPVPTTALVRRAAVALPAPV